MKKILEALDNLKKVALQFEKEHNVWFLAIGLDQPRLNKEVYVYEGMTKISEVTKQPITVSDRDNEDYPFKAIVNIDDTVIFGIGKTEEEALK